MPRLNLPQSHWIAADWLHCWAAIKRYTLLVYCCHFTCCQIIAIVVVIVNYTIHRRHLSALVPQSIYTQERTHRQQTHPPPINSFSVHSDNCAVQFSSIQSCDLLLLQHSVNSFDSLCSAALAVHHFIIIPHSTLVCVAYFVGNLFGKHLLLMSSARQLFRSLLAALNLPHFLTGSYWFRHELKFSWKVYKRSEIGWQQSNTMSKKMILLTPLVGITVFL